MMNSRLLLYSELLDPDAKKTHVAIIGHKICRTSDMCVNIPGNEKLINWLIAKQEVFVSQSTSQNERSRPCHSCGARCSPPRLCTTAENRKQRKWCYGCTLICGHHIWHVHILADSVLCSIWAASGCPRSLAYNIAHFKIAVHKSYNTIFQSSCNTIFPSLHRFYFWNVALLWFFLTWMTTPFLGRWNLMKTTGCRYPSWFKNGKYFPSIP